MQLCFIQDTEKSTYVAPPQTLAVGYFSADREFVLQVTSITACLAIFPLARIFDPFPCILAELLVFLRGS